MFKKLRWKLIAVIMALLAAVLGTVLAIQTASTVRQYKEATDGVLRWAMQRGEASFDPFHTYQDDDFSRNEELYSLIPAFYAMTDSRGRAVVAISYNAGVDEEDVARAVEAALAQGTESGELRGQNLRFLLQRRGMRLELSFADLDWERANIRRQVLTAVLLLGAALAGFFVVSWFLSGWLVQPLEES